MTIQEHRKQLQGMVIGAVLILWDPQWPRFCRILWGLALLQWLIHEVIDWRPKAQ